MANDQSIELRVSLQERQMETVAEIVEEIRINYLTRAEFREALVQQRTEFREALVLQRIEFKEALVQQRTEFKEALERQRADFKEALSVQRVEFRAYIDEQLSHYATKEDLERMRQDTRNWVITVGISLAALQFTMQMVFFQWYTHLR